MQLLLCYTQALFTHMAQTSACNRHHALDQQLCRWLLLNLDRQHGLLESLVFGAAAAAGFGLALLLFAALRERIDSGDVPAAFKGTPIALVTAGLMALAFMGFSGLGGS